MVVFPNIRDAARIIKQHIPCEDCDCLHRMARLEVQVADGEVVMRTLRLNCGKVPLITLGEEYEEPIYEVLEDAALYSADDEEDA